MRHKTPFHLFLEKTLGCYHSSGIGAKIFKFCEKITEDVYFNLGQFVNYQKGS